MWTYNYPDELYHHGIKGQKWGVRRYQNKDGSLTDAGVKRYAQDSYNSNKTRAGKVYDKITDAHNYQGNITYARASQKEREERAKQYVKDEEIRKQREEKQLQDFREERRDVYRERSTGAKVATNILAGPFANRTYNSVIAAGGTVNHARAVTAVSTYMAGPVGHLAVSAAIGYSQKKKTE